MKKIILLLLTVAALGFGCSKDDSGSGSSSQNESAEVRLWPFSINFERHWPADEVIDIKCASSWEIKGAPDWCVFEPNKGEGDAQVSLRVPRNESQDARRYAVIKINNATLYVSQGPDVAHSGDKVGSFQSKSNLQIVEYRTYGNVTKPVDTYTLIGAGGLNEELTFMYDYVNNLYYFESWLKFRYKISQSYHYEDIRIFLMYPECVSNMGHRFVQAHISDLKGFSFDKLGLRKYDITTDHAADFSDGNINITFNDCKLKSQSGGGVYYLVNGQLCFTVDYL